MRKILTIFVVALATFALGACGEKDTTTPNTPPSSEPSAPTTPIAVSWTGISANGVEDVQSTTILTLTFDGDPKSLGTTNVFVAGASRGEMTGSGTIRYLTISNITVDEGANITVELTNPYGYTITNKLKTVAVHRLIAPPSAPTLLTAVSGGKNDITLTWSAPASNGGKPITTYYVERKINNEWASGWPISVPGNPLTSYYDDLPTGVLCEFRVRASNGVQDGAWAYVSAYPLYVPVVIDWLEVTANGTAETEDTTVLTLEFDVVPQTLSIHDITITGATKGTLSGNGNTRQLTITDITVEEGETITIEIADPAGFVLLTKTKTVVIHRAPIE